MLTDGVITLRAPEFDDVDVMYIWENDYDAWVDGRVRAPMSHQLLMAYVQNYNPDAFASGQLRMVIVENATSQAVGAIDLYEVDSINRHAGVGVIIEQSARRRGLATHALMLMSRYAQTDLGLHQLWAVVSGSNQVSRLLFEHAGYSTAGCLRSWVRIGEHYTDAYVYQRLLVADK